MEQETARVEHLKLIQGIIGRMARNSFAVKSFAVAITTGLIALIATTETWTAIAGTIVVLPLWALDGYFLMHERRFRKLYERVRRGEPSPLGSGSYFTMETTAEGRKWAELASASLAWSHILFYTALLLAGVAGVAFVENVRS